MKVIIFGATGMVGQGALREALLDPDVTAVLTVGRRKTGQTHAKLREIEHANMFDYGPIAHELAGYDACFFCLGVSSAGMSEEAYKKITYDMTMAAAKALLVQNPDMTFVYVSGAGTDSSEKGGSMWARVKGKTENDLLKLPFKAAYMLRPGAIRPMHGIKSGTRLYQTFYTVLAPIMPLMEKAFPKYVTNIEKVGAAMLRVAKSGAPKKVLENWDL
jgi:uncharacterized protein YbjT (DUF2867 family)